MQHIHHGPATQTGPETAGATIHWTSQYDVFARLLGLGVNGSNSRIIVEMAQIKPGDTVLDVGCGTGDLTLAAQQRVGPSGSAQGIDPSPEGIAIAREKAKRTGAAAGFSVGLIEKLDFPDATFDVVITRLVIHHLPDDLKRRGFAEIFRVLKPGGRFFVADFQPPAHPILAHITLALVGHRMMMESNVQALPPLLASTGFANVTMDTQRSSLLAYISAMKPA